MRAIMSVVCLAAALMATVPAIEARGAKDSATVHGLELGPLVWRLLAECSGSDAKTHDDDRRAQQSPPIYEKSHHTESS